MEFTQQLCDFAASVLGQPYERPNTVCMALAFRGLDAATGNTLYADHQQHFKSAAAMRRFLGDDGLDGLIEYLGTIGFVEVPVTQMQVGDIGFTGQPPFGIGAALLVGSRLLTAHPETGVVLYSLSDVPFVRAVRLNRFES
ncbi:DUF6950 family protein [Deefgea rivuli]|uniref:DUF6950 family protein n=1 Tax=Deefgea rivuli TaxID=400948 RepID=UPI000486753E|nr:hypothetical protein [Deefgea rivuli]